MGGPLGSPVIPKKKPTGKNRGKFLCKWGKPMGTLLTLPYPDMDFGLGEDGQVF